jgi:hypothetical protein
VQHALAMCVVDGVADLAGVVEARRQIERAVRDRMSSSVSPGWASITMKTVSSFSAMRMVTILGWLGAPNGRSHATSEITRLLWGTFARLSCRSECSSAG